MEMNDNPHIWKRDESGIAYVSTESTVYSIYM